jgi:hypothetical protein
MKIVTVALLLVSANLASAATPTSGQPSETATQAVVGVVLIGLGLIRKSRAQ